MCYGLLTSSLLISEDFGFLLCLPSGPQCFQKSTEFADPYELVRKRLTMPWLDLTTISEGSGIFGHVHSSRMPRHCFAPTVAYWKSRICGATSSVCLSQLAEAFSYDHIQGYTFSLPHSPCCPSPPLPAPPFFSLFSCSCCSHLDQ